MILELYEMLQVRFVHVDRQLWTVWQHHLLAHIRKLLGMKLDYVPVFPRFSASITQTISAVEKQEKNNKPLTGCLSLFSWTCHVCTWCAAALRSARLWRSVSGFCRSPGGHRWQSWSTPPVRARRTQTYCHRPLQGETGSRVRGRDMWGGEGERKHRNDRIIHMHLASVWPCILISLVMYVLNRE